MRLRNLLAIIIILIVGFGNQSKAQDIHFTTWDMSPLTVNPAFAGSYLGSFRIGGIYRDQWRGGFEGGAGLFTTPSAYIDAPIIRGFRKNDWVGVGVMFFSDQAGTFDLGYSATRLGAAYHLGLNKQQTSVLTLGVQWGSTSYDLSLDQGTIVSPNPDEFSMLTGGNMMGGNNSFSDYRVGLLFKSLLNDRTNIAIGGSGAYITAPNARILNDFERPLLLQFHGQIGFGLNEKWTLTPQVYYQTTASANELSLQAWGGYKFNKDYTLRPGIGYRATGNAIEALFGVDIRDNIRATLAYDFSLAELASQRFS